MDIENLLNEEIKDELDILGKLGVGTKEHEMAVNDVCKLIDRAIEIDKLGIQEQDSLNKRADAKAALEFEHGLKTKQYELEVDKRKDAKALVVFDQDFRLKQLEEERRDRFVRDCVAIAGVAVPAVITIWGTLKSFEFEKEGTITTAIGRGFINKLLPRK